MPSSQLKRLRTSLREQGVIGPQKSKKQKRKLAQDQSYRNEKRLQRSVALNEIREQFNPFDLKLNARGPKFPVTSNRPVSESAAKGIKGRPGIARSLAEEKRRQTLLVELNNRNKVGGIFDRRFGEDDPTMPPEEKMLERFAREKQRSHKKNSIFDLEDDDEPGEGLTHMGQSLKFDKPNVVDDFNEEDLRQSDDGSADSSDEGNKLKRIRALVRDIDGNEHDDQQDGQPERKKSKKEVMEEIITKSKLHKYERQAAKEENDTLRVELDKELPGIQALLTGGNQVPLGRQKDTVPIIAGMERALFDKDFDQRVKQLVKDQRSQPADRTKTEEEKAEAASKKLKELEEARLKRMNGEEVSEDDDQEESEEPKVSGANRANGILYTDEEEEENDDDDDNFGLGSGIKTRPTAAELGFDDEDDFVIDEDLVASGTEFDQDLSETDGSAAGSDIASDEADGHDDEDSSNSDEYDDNDDDEFTKELLGPEARAQVAAVGVETDSARKDVDGLPFTFECPETYSSLDQVLREYPADKIPTIVQRIRALYHPKLDAKNKERLGNFSQALVDFISQPLGDEQDERQSISFSVLETLIRHIHSLAKTFPVEIANRFRTLLNDIGRMRPLTPHGGDLVLLTAVGSIFPTSDHFHQVVTPAMITICRFLGQKIPQSTADYATGMLLSTLALQWQQFSKRYIPETMNFCLNTLVALAPVAADTNKMGNFPTHEPVAGMRLSGSATQDTAVRRLTFKDCQSGNLSGREDASVRLAIAGTAIQLLEVSAETWNGKASLAETFEPALNVIRHLVGKKCRPELPEALAKQAERTSTRIHLMIQTARLARRPLELHHHRPLAIRSHIPKFEAGFNPDKHYDPDQDRADLSKLRAEHKRERKGALRELRRDANFMAREKLRIKKAKDAAYEQKYKRLVAEIQGEEGREANEYEREKKRRIKSNRRH